MLYNIRYQSTLLYSSFAETPKWSHAQKTSSFHDMWRMKMVKAGEGHESVLTSGIP